jgi:hypothetical protein
MQTIRRWKWLILLVLIVIVRAVLPEVIRRQIETRASEALHARVVVEDVDLGLLRGAVALDGVAVQALDAPSEERPLLAWKRFAIDLRWLPFLWKTIRFATIELVEPDVAVDRLQSGELNLMALVPKSEEPPDAEAEPEPSGWKLGIDYFALRRGGLRFRDLLIGESEPLLLSLESIEVRDIALEPEVYGEPADIKFVVKLENGALRTRARFTPRKEGAAVDVTLDGTRIPVKRSRVYVPGVVWSELTGLLSLGLRYRLETGGRNEVSGTIGLDDLTVHTAELDQPSLTWKSLSVELEKIDLVRHDARVKSVALTGAVLPVKPRDPAPVPVIAAARAAREAREAAAAADAKPTEPAPPWTWLVRAVTLTDTKVRLLSDTPPLDVGVTADVKALSGPAHESSPLKLDLAIEGGKVGLDGTVRLAPVGLAASLTTAALDVPRLVGAAGAMPPGVLQVAKLDSELQVSLGSSAPTAGDAVVSGKASIADLWIEGHDPKEFAAGAKQIAVDLQDVTVPGALAAEPAPGRPTAVALRTVDVDGLYARVTRTETGIVQPTFTSAPPAKPAAAAAPGETAGAPPETPPAPKPAEPATTPAAPAATPAAPGTTIAIEAVKIIKGRVDLTDRTVKPFYWTAYDPIDGELKQVRQPPLEIGSIQLVAVNTKKGVIEVKGGVAKKSDIELIVKELPLMPFNPYVTGMSPYSISRGSLFITTKASIDGPNYKTTTYLTLSNFDLASRSGKHVVLEQLGIPLTVAVALLRDWKGNIDLTIPVEIDEKGTQVGLGTIVTGALVRALVGTLTSPLKVVGFVLPRGGSGESLAPVPISFPPGLSTVSKGGKEQIGQLAEFLAGRPGLGVTLSAPPTPGDVRGLREQALFAKLGPRKGVIGTLRNIGARGRIVDALDARSRGEEAKLEEEDAKALDEYLEEIPQPTPEQIRKLGEERLAVVEKSLRADYGIGDDQISRLPEPSIEPVEGDPGVRVDLGSARR